MIEIPALMDCHQHLRQGHDIPVTTVAAERWCDTVLFMPNTDPPLVSVERLISYKSKLLKNLAYLKVISTLYLTEKTTPEEIRTAADQRIRAVKLYPKGKTTHSQHGIQNYKKIHDVLGAMNEKGMTLLIHPEHPTAGAWEGENAFLDEVWPELDSNFPNLRIVLEHITTEKAVEIVKKSERNRAATITAHHLLATVNDILNTFDAAACCKPVPKTEADRQALLTAATSGDPRFIFGSDSAPHHRQDKCARKSAAGCWTAPFLPQLLAEAFEQRSALDKLPKFAHDHAVAFWKLKPSDKKIRLRKKMTVIPEQTNDFIPFRAGEVLSWSAEQI